MATGRARGRETQRRRDYRAEMLRFREHWGVGRPCQIEAFSSAGIPLCRGANRAKLRLILQTALLSKWGFSQAHGWRRYQAPRMAHSEGRSRLGRSWHRGTAMADKQWGDLRETRRERGGEYPSYNMSDPDENLRRVRGALGTDVGLSSPVPHENADVDLEPVVQAVHGIDPAEEELARIHQACQCLVVRAGHVAQMVARPRPRA